MSSRHSGMTKVLRQNHTESGRGKVGMPPESPCRTIAGRADHGLARESLRRFRTSAFCHELLHPITLRSGPADLAFARALPRILHKNCRRIESALAVRGNAISRWSVQPPP